MGCTLPGGQKKVEHQSCPSSIISRRQQISTHQMQITSISQNHRMVQLEGTFKDDLIQSPRTGSRTPHSVWCFTRAEQRERITSLDLLAMLLFMQLKIPLAFWAASSHFLLISNFSSTNIPKSFSTAALKSFVTHQGQIRDEKVNILKYRAAIQKEIYRLEGCASRSPMKFIKNKCKVQHLGRKNPLNNTVWELLGQEAKISS